MDNTVKKRKQLYKFITKKLEKDDGDFITQKVLGQGGQGKVYQNCIETGSKKGVCIAVKQFYLNNKEAVHISKPFNIDAFKYGNFIELASSQLINQLVFQNICPNFILNYDRSYIERDGVCNDIYPYTALHFNEYVSKSQLYTEWSAEERPENEYYNAYFQISCAIYSMQKYFNMTHLDLHSDNILVLKVKKGGYWLYQINGEQYHLPNLGYVFLLNDFGHAWIPNNFKSWFARQRYNTKRIHKGFDIMRLFRSTLNISKSPKTFKKDIRYIINQLRTNEKFPNIIKHIWGEMYSKIPKSMKIETYNLDKVLDTTPVPKELKHIVVI